MPFMNILFLELLREYLGQQQCSYVAREKRRLTFLDPLEKFCEVMI